MTDPKQAERPEPPSLLKIGANVRALDNLIEEAVAKKVPLDVVRARRHAIRILELLA